ncbi:hypothetical protein CJD38_10635 [Stenotrophobium rhamnosiphilum]|uniref:Uncharacterized protein n=1 Tax=Stenotrophobium rhamnosiphilum TaxID=2029166 RepID=A0A2T5MGN8_9GAMM|nr:hypothetical protein CJD38_10635 [Stenotrophobium rhamnosiphilum]
MYFRAGQYPALTGKPKAEQRKIVAAAIRTYNKHSSLRFFAVLIVLLGSIPLVSNFWGYTGLRNVWSLLWPLACGLIFYVYELWEINGPVLRAVDQYVATLAQQCIQPDAPASGGSAG